MSETEWLRTWSELDAARQERLGVAIGKLLDRGFILKGPATAPDAGYRLLDHHEHAARGYLRLMGWDLRIDRVGGFVQAVHPEGHGRVRLGKNASLLLCVLRLLYQQRAGADRLGSGGFGFGQRHSRSLSAPLRGGAAVRQATSWRPRSGGFISWG